MKIVATLLLLLLAAPVLGAPTISCHCFTDRTYDPQRPDAVDAYVLASAQNSFLAAVFHVDKKQIVKAKMSGTSEADLWIGHFVSSRSDRTLSEVMAARKQVPDWTEALSLLNPDREMLGKRFSVALNGGTEDEMSMAAADEMLMDRLRVAPEVITELRTAGASTRETIVSLFLSRRADHPALSLFTEVLAGNRTWGQLFDGLGIEPSAIDGEIRGMLQGEGGEEQS